MSRSYRHAPISGWTAARTERWWKRKTARAERRMARSLLAVGDWRRLQNIRVKFRRTFGPKDGKQRFDPDENPGLMRK